MVGNRKHYCSFPASCRWRSVTDVKLDFAMTFWAGNRLLKEFPHSFALLTSEKGLPVTHTEHSLNWNLHVRRPPRVKETKIQCLRADFHASGSALQQKKTEGFGESASSLHSQ